MSRVRSKGTKPEMILRKWLWANGFRFRLHRKDLPGKPDIVFPGRRKVIFVHGCFWHKHDCRQFSWPKTNAVFWKNKIQKNVERDLRNQELLKSLGWRVLVVWECTLDLKLAHNYFQEIKRFLDGGR
jgi:DNA mismatch endonuclease (patch repair protein)